MSFICISCLFISSSVDDASDQLQQLSMEELISGLQPLVLWMANSIELLHFIQHEVPQLLPWRRESIDQGGHFVCLFRAVRPSSPVKVVTSVVVVSIRAAAG